MDGDFIVTSDLALPISYNHCSIEHVQCSMHYGKRVSHSWSFSNTILSNLEVMRQ